MTARWLRAPWAPLLLVALVAAGYALGTGLGWGGPGERSWVSYVGALVASGAAAASTLLASRRVSGTRRSLWTYLGLATAAWAAGGAVHAVLELLLGRSAGPSSLADVFYLLSVVPLLAGFAGMSRLPARAKPWVRLLLDASVCAGSIFCVGWVTVLASLYRQAGLPPGALLVDLAHPIVDVIAFCLIVTFLVRMTPTSRAAVRVAFLAVAVIVATDTSYSVALLSGSYTPGGLIDLGWVLGYLLMGAAPWLDRHTGDAEDDRRRPRYAVLLAPAVVGLATLIVTSDVLATRAGARAADHVLFLVGASVLLAVLVRLGWLLLDHVRLVRDLEASRHRLRSLAESSNDVVVITDLAGTVRHVSAGWQQLYGYAPEELIGRALTDLMHPEDLPEAREMVRTFLREGPANGSMRLDARVRAADGTWRHCEATVSRYALPGEGDGLLFTGRDVTDQVALQEQLAHLTFHDGLTGLPNRAYFEERTREVLARQGVAQVAALFLDLDGLTAVNDSVGHASGDHVLVQAARRLRAAVQVDDTVARFGGDEFAVLVETHGDARAVVDLAERIVGTLSEPYRVADRDVALTASVGIAFTTDGVGVLDLLRNADLAMSRAKRLGGGRTEIFAASMHADAVRRMELGTRLRQALANDQFAVEYQPMVELATSRVTGVEALVRWWRDGVLVPPERFIRYAEESGLIVPIGRWVLREACRQVARWREADWEIGVGVNVSARQVTEPRFLDMVAETLAASGLPADALTLEITENVLVDGAVDTIERLRELRELGVRLAIDDFGTGYASLAYLSQLPVDTLKIDPSFVSRLGRDDVATLLTRTVVRLGLDLGLLVVAEGIERPDQLELLREMGCSRGQGYLVARPMAARGVESVLRTGLSPSAGYTVQLPGSVSQLTR